MEQRSNSSWCLEAQLHSPAKTKFEGKSPISIPHKSQTESTCACILLGSRLHNMSELQLTWYAVRLVLVSIQQCRRSRSPPFQVTTIKHSHFSFSFHHGVKCFIKEIFRVPRKYFASPNLKSNKITLSICHAQSHQMRHKQNGRWVPGQRFSAWHFLFPRKKINEDLNSVMGKTMYVHKVVEPTEWRQ